MLRTIITNYEKEFKNELSEVIVSKLNANQKKAFQFILKNADLEDAVLNKKLAKELYKCSPSYSTYKSFKDTFSKLLLKISYLNESQGSKLQKISFELQEELASINKFIYMGLRSAAKSQFKKTLKKALKFQNYEVARSISLIIVEDCVFYGKEKEQKEAVKNYEYINTICDQENEIKFIYGDLIKYSVVSEEVKLKYKSLLNDITGRLKFDTFLFHYYFYSIELIICDDLIYESKCNEAIEYFTKLWFNHSAYICIFRVRLLNYKISKGDYVKSKLIVTALMEDHRPFSYHWYLYALTYVRVLLYSGDTQEAYRWYQKVVKSRNYITLPKENRIAWEVLGMYVYLMIDEIDRISIRKVKYNLNYHHIERS